MNYLDKVEMFHKTFKAPVLDKPQLISEERAALRIKLLREEIGELEDAAEVGNLTEIADALCDIQYILSGTILEFGMKDKFDRLFDEVHRSNMSKACENLAEAYETVDAYAEQGVETHIVNNDETKKYTILRHSDNKILKSVKYSPADLKPLLLEEQAI